MLRNLLQLSIFSWVLGGFAIIVVGLASLRAHRVSKNPISFYFGWFAVVLGIGYLCIYGPVGLSLGRPAVFTGLVFGQVLTYLSFVIQARFLWLTVLKSRVRFFWVILVVAALSLWAFWFDLAHNNIILVTGSAGLTWYRVSPISGYIKDVALLGICLPIGIYLLREAVKTRTSHGRLKSFSLGLAYLLAPIGVASTDLNHSTTTAASAWGTIVAYVLLIVVVVVAPVRQRQL
jgi:hypothetical protein